MPSIQGRRARSYVIAVDRRATHASRLSAAGSTCGAAASDEIDVSAHAR